MMIENSKVQNLKSELDKTDKEIDQMVMCFMVECGGD